MAKRGRKLYQIQREDMDAVLLYLRNNAQHPILDSWESWSRFCRADTPELLQQWCDDYLSPKQWQRTKNYIVAHRKLDFDYQKRREDNSTQMDELVLMWMNKLLR